MKINEILNELKGKKSIKYPEPKTPYDFAYNKLQDILKYSAGAKPANTYQLFVPRPKVYQKNRHDLLSKSYAWDEHGNLKPEYKKYENTNIDKNCQFDLLEENITDLINLNIFENAPVLAGKALGGIGRNKPNAALWTSTAFRLPDGSYTSNWVHWISINQPSWFSDIGYLYKVSNNCRTLQLDSDYDVEEIYQIYQTLGAGNTRAFEYGSYRHGSYSIDFPWNWVTKHFDCVHHNGSAWDGDFMVGWDVESTAFLDTSVLQLIGKVKIHWPED